MRDMTETEIRHRGVGIYEEGGAVGLRRGNPAMRDLRRRGL